MLTLAVIKSSGWTGPRPGDVLNISGDVPQVLGRSSDADIHIDHPKLSRAHAWFAHDINGWFIEDLKSKNGTKLNGRELAERAHLEEGDLLRFASYMFRVMSIEISESLAEETAMDKRDALLSAKN